METTSTKMAGTAPDGFTVHDYVDVMEKQRHQYDTFFALKSWRPKPLLHPEATKSIADKILNSPRMKDTIFQVQHINVEYLNILYPGQQFIYSFCKMETAATTALLLKQNIFCKKWDTHTVSVLFVLLATFLLNC